MRGDRRYLRNRQNNLGKHAFDVCKNLVVPETDNEITHRRHARSFGVPGSLNCMLPAIEFNNELCFGAVEVGNKIVDLYLPLELPAVQPPVAET